MPHTYAFPEIVFVRVLTAGGPYAAGSTISVAFVTPGAARLAAHDAPVCTGYGSQSAIPETISARVVRSAGPYEAGEVLTLSFVDPSIARIHRTAPPEDSDEHLRNRRATDRVSPIVAALPGPTGPVSKNEDSTDPGPPLTITIEPALRFPDGRETNLEIADPQVLDDAREPEKPIAADVSHGAVISAGAPRPSEFEPQSEPQISGVRVRLDWNRDRVRRFVQVVDKLFTIDRLGWYRHVFAMRLLVPDVVLCGRPESDVEALRHLHALRAASIETLGRPLLAAFMPNFSVSPEWLDSIDKPSAARALAGLRDTLTPFSDDGPLHSSELEMGWTISAVLRSELVTAPASSVESLLPLFIPATSPSDVLSEKLTAYRSALISIFGQTAQSAEAVRLNLMARPNHTLDDRLEQLAHAVSATFGELAVA